jgi:hypothetical protein
MVDGWWCLVVHEAVVRHDQIPSLMKQTIVCVCCCDDPNGNTDWLEEPWEDQTI